MSKPEQTVTINIRVKTRNQLRIAKAQHMKESYSDLLDEWCEEDKTKCQRK